MSSQTAEGTLRGYVRAFETLDAASAVPLHDSPCMFIAPFGVSLAADGDSALRTASPLIARARSQKCRRTEMRGLLVEALDGNLALLTGVFVRHDTADQEIGRFGFTYIMRNAGAGWRISVAVGHEATAREG